MSGGFCKNLHDLKRLGVREWHGRILWWRNWPGLAGRGGCRKNPADPQVFGLTTLGGRGVGWMSMAGREPGGGRKGTGM